MLRTLSRAVRRYSVNSRVKNPSSPAELGSKHLQPELRKRRLLLNSRNRGRLETELFLGGYATDKLWHMNETQLDEYEKILNETDTDLYNWFCGIQPLPEDIQELSVWHDVLQYIKDKKHNHYAQETPKTFKADYNRTDHSNMAEEQSK